MPSPFWDAIQLDNRTICNSSIREHVRIDLGNWFSLFRETLLWQISVATDPHVFVIATCMWSAEIIYLLVSCNKRPFSSFSCVWHLSCLDTYSTSVHLSVSYMERTYLPRFISLIEWLMRQGIISRMVMMGSLRVQSSPPIPKYSSTLHGMCWDTGDVLRQWSKKKLLIKLTKR